MAQIFYLSWKIKTKLPISTEIAKIGPQVVNEFLNCFQNLEKVRHIIIIKTWQHGAKVYGRPVFQ